MAAGRDGDIESIQALRVIAVLVEFLS